MFRNALLVGLLVCQLASASFLFDGTNDRLERTASVPVTTYPFSLVGWVKVTGLGVNDALFCLGVDGSGDNYFSVQISSADTPVGIAFVTSGATASAGANITSTTTWYHLAAVFTSATARAIYINGANAGTSETSKAPAGVNNLTLGEKCDNSNDFAGRLAHWGIWDIALDATAAANLAGGDNPLAVNASDLVAYWPLTADANDVVADFDLTAANQAAVDADNPTVDAPPSGSALAPLSYMLEQ